MAACQTFCTDGGCKAASASVAVTVLTAPPKAVDGVQATLTGPETAIMLCHANNSLVLCLWPVGVAFAPGTYSLQVSAPGYQTTTVQAQVTASSSSCGCTVGSIQPSIVSLSPTDGGLD
jgi:hypothetical protein